MADIRINSLPTTASASSSDDFLALDGATNGTRKLNAFSPTFGGNLTVSGTATLGPTNPFKFDTNLMQSTASGFNGALVRSAVSTVGNPTFSNVDDTDTGIYFPAANTLAITTGGTQRLSVDATATTLAGNLTVSGTGTSSVAGNLALNGATSYLAISPTTAVTNNVALQLSVDVADNRAIRMTNTASGGHAYDFIPGGGGDAGSLGLYDNTAGAYRLFIPNTGNVLIGTTTDGGQKLQVSGTGYFSAGITIGGTSDVGTGGVLWQDAGSPYSTHLSGANLKFETGSNFARTTALTLDSSQNATFEKTVGSALGFRGTKSVVVSSDTTVEIAADSGLGGIYQITVSGSNRVQRVLVSVAAQQYDNAKISVLSNYTYGGQAVLSNFRVTSNAGNTVRALICDVGNRNGASVTVSASAMFDTNGPLTLVSPSTYTTSVTTGYPMSVASGPSASDLTLGGNLTVSGTQNVLGLPASASALSTNSTMTFELTSNTSLTIKVRGTDGTTRSVALTLA